MTIYAGLEEMRTLINDADWERLESEFKDRCIRLDPSAAARVGAIEVGAYRHALRAGLAAIEAQVTDVVRAVYWEFDPDNDWQSAFFACRSYRAEVDADDDWAADFEDSSVVIGPPFPAFAREFAQGWDRDAASMARNLYLVARTIAALAAASANWAAEVPLCAGYHDQDRVYRVRTSDKLLSRQAPTDEI